MKKYELIIGWLYPDLMSTYGDIGNITVLLQRAKWRGIQAKVLNINVDTTAEKLKEIDLLFGGGAQDREQEIVMRDLAGEKGEIIKNLIENMEKP